MNFLMEKHSDPFLCLIWWASPPLFTFTTKQKPNNNQDVTDVASVRHIE